MAIALLPIPLVYRNTRDQLADQHAPPTFANASHTYFGRAIFSHAIFSHAIFSHAIFSYANLRRYARLGSGSPRPRHRL